MIELTRLNGNLLLINSDLIKYVESSPDTMLTLVNGDKIVVRENCESVLKKTITYRAQVLSELLKLGQESHRAGLMDCRATLNLPQLPPNRNAGTPETRGPSGSAVSPRTPSVNALADEEHG